MKVGNIVKIHNLGEWDFWFTNNWEQYFGISGTIPQATKLTKINRILVLFVKKIIVNFRVDTYSYMQVYCLICFEKKKKLIFLCWYNIFHKDKSNINNIVNNVILL